ncbi:MAG: hypothetical protein CVV23_12695 [Ignavibacteriae bacterium HGW-Ignavibacteriae-2]|nr:MAG: hypothetical protein CVV23_12695 [Ignavibacteriae bacterium HGW-Ignavibacteriae-2]
MTAINNRYLASLLFLLLFSSFVLAQNDSNKNLDEKLKSIKGDIEKITVSTNSGDVVFIGKEAENLLKRLKNKSVVFKKLSDSHDNMFFDEDSGRIKKEVKVEEENGKKKVTITTTENGEKKTESFSGAEAEQKLKEINEEKDFNFTDKDGKKFIIKKKHGKNIKWIDEDDDVIFFHDSDDAKKEIEVKVEKTDDGLKVIVKNEVDGKVNVKVFEGEEAEEFLEGEDECNVFKINIDNDDPHHLMFKTKTSGKHMNADSIFEWVDKDDKLKTTKKINVEVIDGVKKLTVTTKENGEEKTELYEGEEADKYLEKMEKDDLLKNELKDGENQKIIIKRKK